MPLINDLNRIKKEAQKEISQSKNLAELDQAFKKFLGREGKLSEVFKELKNLSSARRKKIGQRANSVKEVLTSQFRTKKSQLESEEKAAKKEKIDISIPAKKAKIGHLHPLTLVQRKIQDVFNSLGFSVVEGPQLEKDYYNFDALNIPPNHPARDLWDTFWIKENQRRSKSETRKWLLRTHTSPVQIRYMEKNNPPLRIIVPGRVFRHEATDPSHDIQCYQLEGLMVDKDITVANFKAITKNFFDKFFGKKARIRLRPSFYPFVEPGFDVDMSCIVCKGKGCSVCKQTGWLEMMGAGMVHPKVLDGVGYNPSNWQGFAFGMGIDRLAMMKYKIDDIRLFYRGDLRFLKQF